MKITLNFSSETNHFSLLGLDLRPLQTKFDGIFKTYDPKDLYLDILFDFPQFYLLHFKTEFQFRELQTGPD